MNLTPQQLKFSDGLSTNVWEKGSLVSCVHYILHYKTAAVTKMHYFNPSTSAHEQIKLIKQVFPVQTLT